MIVIPNGPRAYTEIDNAGTTRQYELGSPDVLHSDTQASVIYTDTEKSEEYWFHGVQYPVDYWIDYALNGMTPPCT